MATPTQKRLNRTVEEINPLLDKLDEDYTKAEIDTLLEDKVDKETGKGLSTNDYTTAEKTKLENLAEIKTVGTGLNLDDNGELTATGGGSGGTTNYNDLSNKPQINGNTLSGNKTSAQLGLASASDIPTTLADLSDDSTHRTVSDTEKATWNAKQNAISDLETIRSGASAGATAVQPVSGKGLSTNDYTTAEKTKLAGIAEGAEVNVQSNWTQTTTTADDYIKNKPTLGTAAAKNATDAYNATGTDVTTGKAVAAALATLPEPMVFKGSLGTGGTITSLPTASSLNKGYVYKVITAGTYASQSAKVGDTFISDGSAWVLIPSGDEPSGTVTNVAVANGGGLTVSGSPIASSGTITIGHSNSVTAKTSSSLKKFTYDAYGHVTGSSELSTAESNALASGIDSTKVAQIETNKNNISYIAKNNVINTFIRQTGSYTNNGVTFTTNADCSITLANTATGGAAVLTLSSTLDTTDDTYILYGDGFIDGVYMDTYETGWTNQRTFNSWIDTVPNTKIWRIVVSNGTNADGVTIRPMMCKKSLFDGSYHQYAMSNEQITAWIIAHS